MPAQGPTPLEDRFEPRAAPAGIWQKHGRFYRANHGHMAENLLNAVWVSRYLAYPSSGQLIMRIKYNLRDKAGLAVAAFALPEVLIATAIIVLVYGGAILAYIQTDRRAEWSGYSLEAQALSVRSIEQARAAKWDTQGGVVVDQSPNIYTRWTNLLDLPYSGSNFVYATNFTTVTTVSNSLYQVHMFRVDTVWPWRGNIYTNTTVTYRAPN